MCGFIISTGKIPNTLQKISVLSKIKNRGPDMSRDLYLEKDQIWFGFQRLAINDLTKNGMQPMTYRNRYTIVFNGEIYNFKKLKINLKQLGHIFQSETDTEVLLAAYSQWGEEMLNKIEGMFVFVIWDSKKKSFFIARDPLGQKQVFFYFKNNKFLIASNPQAIKCMANHIIDLNKSAISYYLALGYIPSEKGIWNDINTIDSGSYLKFNYENNRFDNFTKKKYWELKNFQNDTKNNSNNFEEIFSTVCNEHTNSDVPIGIAISGGLDSNSILYQIKNVKNLSAFCIGYKDQRIDESKYAEQITNHLSIELNLKILENQEHLEEAEDLVCSATYQPQGYSSLTTFFLLSKLVSEHKKVLITGDGGDEIFLGYDWYKSASNIDKFKQFIKHVLFNDSIEVKFNELKKKSIFHKHILNLFPRFLPNEIDKILNLKEKFNYAGILNLFKEQFDDSLPLHSNLQIIDLNNFTKDHICTKIDNMGMHNSLEVRAPFLDRRMVSWALNQTNQNNKKTESKKILKKFLKEKKIINFLNKNKQGFSLKLKNQNLKNKIDYIKTSKLMKEEYLNSELTNLLQNDKNIYTEARIKTCWNIAKWYEYQ